MTGPPRYDGLADWYDREIGGLKVTTTAIDTLGRLVGAALAAGLTLTRLEEPGEEDYPLLIALQLER
jgi:hypothetical protein